VIKKIPNRDIPLDMALILGRKEDEESRSLKSAKFR
jgi:hypothetical protein